jgi:hypothetical protein
MGGPGGLSRGPAGLQDRGIANHGKKRSLADPAVMRSAGESDFVFPPFLGRHCGLGWRELAFAADSLPFAKAEISESPGDQGGIVLQDEIPIDVRFEPDRERSGGCAGRR